MTTNNHNIRWWLRDLYLNETRNALPMGLTALAIAGVIVMVKACL